MEPRDGIPKYHGFVEPLLRHLAKHPEGQRAREAHEGVATAVGLTEEQKLIRLPSERGLLYRNRIGWAHNVLKEVGLSHCPERGVWRLTPAGTKLLAEHPARIPDSRVAELVRTAREARRSRRRAKGSEESEQEEADASSDSPEERIGSAIEELKDSVASELLEMIGQSTPTFFEGLVLELLHKMGYGTSRHDLQRIGGSGDGGIDGIISLDRLGLEKVYVQAKRWKDNVGRPQIQGFYGALAGRRATKGVFITTSAFSRDAEEFASQVSDSIVLVDGSRLTELMIEYGVGVSHEPVNIPRVDSDFFDDG